MIPLEKSVSLKHLEYRHDPMSKDNQQKSKRQKCKRSWGALGHSEPTSGCFRGLSPLIRKYLGSKEHQI